MDKPYLDSNTQPLYISPTMVRVPLVKCNDALLEAFQNRPELRRKFVEDVKQICKSYSRPINYAGTLVDLTPAFDVTRKDIDPAEVLPREEYTFSIQEVCVYEGVVFADKDLI